MEIIILIALSGFGLAWYGGHMDRQERRRQDRQAQRALDDVLWRRDQGLL